MIISGFSVGCVEFTLNSVALPIHGLSKLLHCGMGQWGGVWFYAA